MKKAKLLFALSALYTGLQSQPLTGLDTYVHPTQVRLSDGTTTSFNSSGFILAGYQPFSAASTDNIYIDKTDTDGNFNGTTGEFSNSYNFAAGPRLCDPNLINAINCYGVSLAELKYSVTTPDWYVMAAAFDRGCLYSGLNINGAPVTPVFYSFPLRATAPTKPVILASTLFPGKLYICGSYKLGNITHMYVMNIAIGGSFGWTQDYNCGTGTVLIPLAMIESPYAPAGSPELVIVGGYNDGSPMLSEGFFARLDVGAGGSVLQFNTYGSGGSSRERFFAVDVASSPAGGPPGYVVGGGTDFNPAQGTSWMLKMDPNGNISWNSVILAATGTNGIVMGVKERFSSTYGRYEYYGAASENNGMTVFKLDENGNVFFEPGNMNNEFIYNDNLGGAATPQAVTFLDNGSVNDGIHVYGTNNMANGDFLLARACFNGAAGNAGCTTANITLNVMPPPFVSPGPNFMNNPFITTGAGLQPCSDFNFYLNTTNVASVINPCDNNVLPAGGNQNRTAVATGIKANSASGKFSLSPNPVSDKLTVSYTSATDAEVNIGLYNNLGQLVTPVIITKATTGSNQYELDLNHLDLNSGVYFVTVKADGASTTKKIIYTR